ncbi:MAG: penicillin acylase family protein [Proteobacteria bacterium]|nr:penicillin acylase family protein [Pseudomonadota bacterium]
MKPSRLLLYWVGRTCAAWALCAALIPAAAATPVREVQALKGLQQPATLIIDRAGIPHIYARTARDAYFLQGYNAARDRLWQIDLWRKRGLGRLAASLGPAYIDQDRAARLLLYRGDMQREWAAYAPGARQVAGAFAAGINAYVAEVRAGRRPLPEEFSLTGSQPETWEPQDIVRIRSHGLVANVQSEVERAQVACQAGLAADRLRVKLEPPHEVQVPAGLDPCAIPADVLKDYALGTQPVRFQAPGATAAADRAPPAPEGSNNWAIAPSHSATGRAILANDPHRSLTVPGLRYIVHLEAPGLSLIGAGEPALPGISFGHNGHAAFGFTIFETDQEDLYVYELNPADPDEYRYRGGWEKMRIVHERIEVKGEPARQVELRFTRHGPVLRFDPAAGRAFALRSVWSEPGTAPYFNGTRLAAIRTWQQFQAARGAWGAPPENLLYADTAGNIGWAPGARVPVRPNWDGLLPVPGDGRYEWRGFLTGAQLPARYNPAEGWLATANEMNLPPGYPHTIAYEWGNRSRIERIEQVLGSKLKVGLEDSMALQNDNHDVLAGTLVELLRPLPATDAKLARALDLLTHWDLVEGPGSTATSVYQVWLNHLAPMTIARLVPAPAQAVIGDGSLAALAEYLHHPDARLGAEPSAARDEILLKSLAAAMDELEQRLGADVSGWRWGRLHQMRFRPAIAALADPATQSRLSLPAVELGGSGDSPHAAAFDPPRFDVVAGASVRIVLDVGDWDRSVAINAPGQSGDAGSAHYADMLQSWAAGGYVPLPYSRAAVEAAAETVTVLTPAR